MPVVMLETALEAAMSERRARQRDGSHSCVVSTGRGVMPTWHPAPTFVADAQSGDLATAGATNAPWMSTPVPLLTCRRGYCGARCSHQAQPPPLMPWRARLGARDGAARIRPRAAVISVGTRVRWRSGSRRRRAVRSCCRACVENGHAAISTAARATGAARAR